VVLAEATRELLPVRTGASAWERRHPYLLFTSREGMQAGMPALSGTAGRPYRCSQDVQSI